MLHVLNWYVVCTGLVYCTYQTDVLYVMVWCDVDSYWTDVFYVLD